MTTKYFRNEAGEYIGAFAAAPPYTIRTPQEPIIDPETGDEVFQPDLVEIIVPEVIPPAGGIEVPFPPEDARAIWDADSGVWMEPSPSLPSLTARQLRLGLLSAGITPAMVEAEIEQITNETDRETAKIEWEYASEYQRDHPLIDQLGLALGLSEDDINTMWLSAATL